MKNTIKVLAVILLAALYSCNSKPTVQEYFIEHQEDNDFIAIDLPSSLLDTDGVQLTDTEKEALESIKKVNFLALPLKEKTKARFEEEKSKIQEILKDEKYQTLMKFGSNGMKAELKYVGDDDDVDEVIVFASHQEKGLAIVRVLGENMKPENVAELAKAFDKGDFDTDTIKGLTKGIQID